MAGTGAKRRVVRAQAKGQVTLPSEFREALGIAADTLLEVRLVGEHLEITPVRSQEESLRRYTEEDVRRFLEEDQLDEQTARRIRALLDRGEL